MIVFVIFALIFVFAVAQTAFSEDADGLGEKSLEPSADGGEAVDGVFVDVGEFKVFVPDTWMLIPVMDFFGGSPNKPKTNEIKLCKGAESQFDVMTKPSLEIVFYGKKQGIMPPKSVYRDVTELEPFTTGTHHWTGFKASAFKNKKLILLWEDTGVFQYQINLWPEGDTSSVGLDDPELLKILGSISPNKIV